MTRARGLSREIYRWLEIVGDGDLAPEVRKELDTEGFAVLWDYPSKCEVVHIVNPGLGGKQRHCRRRWKLWRGRTSTCSGNSPRRKERLSGWRRSAAVPPQVSGAGRCMYSHRRH